MLSEAARMGGGLDGGFTRPAPPPQSDAPRLVEPAAPASAPGLSGSLLSIGPNPAITYDLETRILLFQVLDSETGEIKQQWPHEHQVEAYRRQIRETAPSGEDSGEAANANESTAPEAPAPLTGSGGVGGDSGSGSDASTGGEAVLI